MKYLSILVIMLIIFSQKNFSQDTLYKWKKIPVEDLKMTTYEQAPSADAVVLQQYIDVYFDIWQDELRYFYEIGQRIKILTEEGKKYADVDISYIALEDFERLVHYAGFTYNINNNAVSKTKLKKKITEKTTEDDIVEHFKFTMPDVQVGSVIEYKYTIASLNFIEPETFYFQKEIPVRYSEFKANIPDVMNYNFKIVGFNQLDTIISTESFTMLNWIFRNEDPIPSGLTYRSKDFSVKMNLKLDSYYYSYVMKNIPAFQSEDYIDSYLNYIYSISLNLKSVNQEIGYYGYIQQLAWKDLTKRLYQTTEDDYYIMSKQKSDFKHYPTGYILYYTKSWDDFSEQLLTNENYGLQLIRAWKAKKIIEEIYDEEKTEIENIIKIYNFVKDTIKWNGNYNVFTTKTLEEVFNSKQGNSTEINFLLIQLLRKAEFEANPVLIKTRNEGKPDSTIKSVNQFNHTIVAVETDSQIIFLDATEKNRPYDVLNIQDYNKYGFLVKKINSQWLEIKNYSENKKKYTDTLVFENEKVIINRNLIETGHFAHEKRNQAINLENLYKNFNNTIYPKIEILNFEEIEKELITNSTIEIEKNYDKDKKTIMLYPFKYNTNFTNPFETIYRNYPVNFDFLYKIEYQLVVEIPEGYKITNFSKTENYNINIDEALLRIDIEDDNENYFILNLKFYINKKEYPVSQYYLLRDLFVEYSNLSKFFIYFEKL